MDVFHRDMLSCSHIPYGLQRVRIQGTVMYWDVNRGFQYLELNGHHNIGSPLCYCRLPRLPHRIPESTPPILL